MRTERFLGVSFTIAGNREIAAFIESQIGGKGPKRIILHGNAHTLYLASQSAALRAITAGPQTLLLFEGIALKLGRFLSRGEWYPDVNGTDLVPIVLAAQREHPLRLALVGGAPGIASAAARMLTRGLRDVEIVAVFDGYGDQEDQEKLIGALEQARPDLVLVGLGTPLQEHAAMNWAAAVPDTLFWAVGGLFDYHAGRSRRAPFWIRRARLEWAWRILREPVRLGPRYIAEAPWLLRALWRQAHDEPRLSVHGRKGAAPFP